MRQPINQSICLNNRAWFGARSQGNHDKGVARQGDGIFWDEYKAHFTLRQSC